MLSAYVRRPRAAQGQRRSPHPRTARTARPPRLRNRQADRPAVGWRDQIPRRVALPDVVPARAPRPHSGPMGRARRSTAQALLPSNRRGPEDARVAAPQLEGVSRRAEPRGADSTRVTAKRPARDGPGPCPAENDNARLDIARAGAHRIA